jgi:hypothetical protein
MSSRRSSLHELSAYRERQRRMFPHRPVRWDHVFTGFVLIGVPTAMIIIGFIGWAG